ncbi:hypothetical protein OF83DRAFT_1120457 [Amylostereum chailletii]|nr:hypothetical protein OF83DRAFT_1120457 [Amylostereum chailletii]
MSCIGSLQPNHDISGIGVRVAFYAQASLSILLAQCGVDRDASFWTMAVTTFALFISAFVLYGKGELILYDAIIVSILLYMHANAAAWSHVSNDSSQPRTKPVADADYNAIQKDKDAEPPTSNGARHAQSLKELCYWVPGFVLAIIFGFFVWARVSKFGYNPVCNAQTVFVIFGAHTKATHTGRTAALAVNAVYTAFVVIGILLCTIPTPTAWRGEDGANTDPASASRTPTTIYNYKLPAMVVIPGIFAAIIEPTIIANRSLFDESATEQTWTMGQIFPLVMLAMPVTSLVKHLWTRPSSLVPHRR